MPFYIPLKHYLNIMSYISKPYGAQSFSSLCKGIGVAGLSKFEWHLCQINENRK